VRPGGDLIRLTLQAQFRSRQELGGYVLVFQTANFGEKDVEEDADVP
jgi:hypothetical protein